MIDRYTARVPRVGLILNDQKKIKLLDNPTEMER